MSRFRVTQSYEDRRQGRAVLGHTAQGWVPGTDCQLQPATKEIGDLAWQRGELIAVEPQPSKLGELGNLSWQRGELVAAEHQLPEVGELGDLGRQHGGLVLGTAPALASVALMHHALRPDGDLPRPERTARGAGRIGTAVGAVAGSAASVAAVTAFGVPDLGAAGFPPGLPPSAPPPLGAEWPPAQRASSPPPRPSSATSSTG